MALKRSYGSQGDIPEALRGFYRQDGSKWVLDADADGGDEAPEPGDAKRKLEEFRTNNKRLAAEIEARNAKMAEMEKRLMLLGDRDPVDVARGLELLEHLKGGDDAALIRAGKLDEVISRRIKPREADWQKKLQDAQTKIDETTKREAAMRDRAAGMILERRVRDALAAKKYRLRPTAEEDALILARREFQLGEDLDGDLAPTGTRFSSLDEWVSKLPELKPHYFEGGGGGGVDGRPAGGRMENGVRVVRRSEIADKDYANALAEQQAGKLKVVGG